MFKGCWNKFMEIQTSSQSRVDAWYGGSFLWRNGVFSLGTFYSNAYGD
jgi:hypothetical protein